jgi:hypothetical protein
MPTLPISLKRILKAFCYSVLILLGLLTLAAIIWTVTGNPALGSCSFWCGLFLSILVVFIDDLKQREAFILQQSHENVAGTSPSHAPVLTWGIPGASYVSIAIVVNLHVRRFALNLDIHTDSVRFRCVLSQNVPTHTPTNLITQD